MRFMKSVASIGGRCNLSAASQPPRKASVDPPKPKAKSGQQLPAAGGGVSRPVRVLIAKPGLDGHDRGALVVARALRDAGMEVIYTGLRRTPEQIVEAALQEDVDAIGVSVLSGAHHHLVARILELLRGQGMDDVTVFVGGIIPDQDIPALLEMGVASVFQPGASTTEIVSMLRERLKSS